MKDMSISRHRARELVSIYDHSLEQQIVGRGSSLACRDEELWKQVQGLLKDGDAQETHCLGLDPLRVMEESLTAAAAAAATTTTATCAGRVKARGGMQGLAKAFEVLEQAALNLYLGPWRDEYKVVKMYSGMFTHNIKPVLSMPQIEKLFGLLGYQLSSSRHEQLCLQPPRVSAASLDDLLCLSCAFFLARCECCLLLTALGKHVGEAQWELSLVRERQRGSSVQVALDNTKKALDVNQPLIEQFDGEGEVDLYTDEHVNGGQREVAVDESPRSLTWMNQSGASPPPIKTHSNGVTSLSSSSGPLSTREHVCVSTYNCQLTKTSPLEPDTTRSFSAGVRQGRRPCEELRFDKGNSQSLSLEAEALGLCERQAEANHLCSCLQTSPLFIKLCIECNTSHDVTCVLLQQCMMENHHTVFPDNTTEEMELREVSPQAGSLRVSGMSTSPTLTSSSAAMSSLALHDDPKSIIVSLHPITYHECCDLAKPDPQVLCHSCGVFHSGSCREINFCQIHHSITPLGVCSCGRACSRNPLVLCRYCGNEYCSDCWYRNPVVCTCGQTFDQSSSV
ncbi:spermatogenesis associated 2-like [Plectropomus leopardus]|uniref:spermatogenesis associated 2-like n=1 Tax=Plectropomus leopardus TaxID=160734 RepID=UPI001C4B076E|nr:spermatogenesis associated 2-like [Plectropomus leopardus]XP_042351339.1 spermatogenesis associated 2-like [Plectropomus leopardus]